MSSPMNSLDKTKKSPSNPSKSFGKRSVPFRRKDFANDLDFLEELEQSIDLNTGNTSDMDICNSHSLSPSQGHSKTSLADSDIEGISSKKMSAINSNVSTMFNPLGNVNKPKVSNSSAPNDIELLSTMMKRITQLEKQTAFCSREIVEKDKKIKVLEEKLLIIKKSQNSKENEGSSRVTELEVKCRQLQQQVIEMETFLADYGMIWVGEKSDGLSDKYIEDDLDDESIFVPVAQTPVSPKPRMLNFKVDYDLIIRNVRQLNIIAGEGSSKIEKTKDGARLKIKESVPLTLYANGIMMFNGPFRSLDDITAKRCLGDLMDGYFPSELQQKYPDGVPFKITDLRDTVFKDPRLIGDFPGKGRVLQDDGGTGTAVQTDPPATTKTSSAVSADQKLKETSALPGPRLTVNQFMEKLPKNVVHDGKVIDIRSSLKEHLTDGSKTTTTEVVETKVVQEIQERMKSPSSSRPGTAKGRGVATIRVKTEHGLKTYILKMKFTDTIGDLKRYIDQQRPNYRAPYEVISTFPKQAHNDMTKTLQESGLVPTANLHLRRKNQLN